MSTDKTLSQFAIETNSYFAKVYSWMTVALILSGGIAYWASASGTWIGILTAHPGTMFLLIILQLGLVVALAGWVMRMSLPVAAIVFLGYAALTGLTFSTIFLIYTAASIAKVFAITAGAFAALSIYGFTTKRDLTAWGGFLFMSLMGIIIASVVNIWFHSPMIDWVVTFGGIVVFAGLTAYDTQKLRAFNQIGNMNTAEDHKEAIYGALTLYLDFINLFLLLLRVLGDRR